MTFMRDIEMRDIESIRPSDEAMGERFTAQQRESMFQEVLQARVGVAPITSGRRRWPSVVAASVAGLAVAALAVQTLTPHSDSAAPPVVASRTAGTSSERSPNPPPLGNVSAVAMLGQVAVAAAAAPAAVEGSFLHVVRVEEQSGADPSAVTHDDYVDADGWLWSHRSGDDNLWLLAAQGQGATMLLPTDPNALDAELRAAGGSNSADERVYKGIHEILTTETAPPALRAAAITVLQRIAENPQAPETTKEGETATPTVTVTSVVLDATSGTGYRAAITDPTSRPGVERWLVLNASGQIMQTGTTGPDFTSNGTITTREWVTGLPSDFVEILGTEHEHREVGI